MVSITLILPYDIYVKWSSKVTKLGAFESKGFSGGAFAFCSKTDIFDGCKWFHWLPAEVGGIGEEGGSSILSLNHL